MSYPAALFDLDGTLLDTLDDLADAMNRVLAACGLPERERDAYRYYVGDGMLNLARRAAPEGTPVETVAEMAHSMDAEYDAGWRKKTRVYDGVSELLAALAEAGVKMAVLSNKPHRFTELVVAHFFPGVPFAAVYGAREGVPKKPDPAGALQIAREFGLEAKDFLYFGDTNTDMRTALAAGMRAVGVAWGFRPVEELLAAGAEAIIRRPGEALELFRTGIPITTKEGKR